MRVKSVLLYILMIIVSTGVNILDGRKKEYTYINLILLLAILIFQILKNLIPNIKEKSFLGISIFEVVVAAILLRLGYHSIIYVLPILLFDIFNKYISVYGVFIINFFINFYVLKMNFLNPSICSLLIIIYLYEIKTQIILKDELKNLNRELRNSQYIMKKKMINLDKYLEQNNIMTALKERNFIAQKLHDHLGHRITSSIMQLEVTKATIENNKEISLKYLDTAMINLREGMEEIREVLKNIKPKEKIITIEDIKKLSYEFEYNSGIKINLKINGEIERVPEEYLRVFYDNIRELLTNSGKYSGATEIKISFNIYNKVIRVNVEDNGVGCDKLEKGLGIKGIEERMNNINGNITYSSDNGFLVNMIAWLEE